MNGIGAWTVTRMGWKAGWVFGDSMVWKRSVWITNRQGLYVGSATRASPGSVVMVGNSGILGHSQGWANAQSA